MGCEKDGRAVYCAKCGLCGGTLKNARSAKKHILRRHYQLLVESQTTLHGYFQISDEPEESDSSVKVPECSSALSDEIIAIIKLFCRVGVPLATLKSKDWGNFLSSIGSSFQMRPARLRCFLLTYATEIKARNYRALKNRNVSLIADGGTVTDKEFYVVLMFADCKLYFGAALQLDKTSHRSIAEALEPVVRRITENGGTPVAIVTDNARNLKLATTDREQPGATIRTATQICSVQWLTGQRMLHISCSVHTAHLILKDMESRVPGFLVFKKGVKTLFAFLRQKTVRQVLKSRGVTEKVTLIQDIKWLSYYHAFVYMNKYREAINSVLCDESIKGEQRPTMVSIPKEWDIMLTALAPLGEFILAVQATDTRLCQVYDYLLQLKTKWHDIGNSVSAVLGELLAERFDTTADGLLAQLTYLFTPKGLNYFRGIFSKLDEHHEEMTDDFKRRFQLRDSLMHKLLDIYQYYGFQSSMARVPLLFHQFLSSYHLAPEPMNVQLDRLRQLTLKTQTEEIPWADFCVAVQRLLELSASESVAERVISHMGLLFPSSRYSSKADLVDAQITVRMQD